MLRILVGIAALAIIAYCSAMMVVLLIPYIVAAFGIALVYNWGKQKFFPVRPDPKSIVIDQ